MKQLGILTFLVRDQRVGESSIFTLAAITLQSVSKPYHMSAIPTLWVHPMRSVRRTSDLVLVGESETVPAQVLARTPRSLYAYGSLCRRWSSLDHPGFRASR